MGDEVEFFAVYEMMTEVVPTTAGAACHGRDASAGGAIPFFGPRPLVRDAGTRAEYYISFQRFSFSFSYSGS